MMMIMIIIIILLKRIIDRAALLFQGWIHLAVGLTFPFILWYILRIKESNFLIGRKNFIDMN